MEIKYTTQTEAAKGDPQAVARLAREQAAAVADQPAATQAPSSGRSLDVHA
ncbi:MAG: hypothetical protein ACRD1E_12050 [Terriglobales bacterium]